MVLSNLPAVYYHLHLDVTKEGMLADGVFHCHSVFSCIDLAIEEMPGSQPFHSALADTHTSTKHCCGINMINLSGLRIWTGK